MKIKNLLLSFTVFVFGLVVTTPLFPENFTISKDNKLYFSKMDKNFFEGFESGDWVILVKEVGENKFEVSFPDDPELKYEKTEVGEVLEYTSTCGQCDYYLKISDSEIDFAKYLEELEGKGEIERVTFGESKQGPFLDIVYGNHKERILKTESKTFLFRTHIKNETDKHHEFIQSFNIITPLKK